MEARQFNAKIGFSLFAFPVINFSGPGLTPPLTFWVRGWGVGMNSLFFSCPCPEGVQNAKNKITAHLMRGPEWYLANRRT